MAAMHAVGPYRMPTSRSRPTSSTRTTRRRAPCALRPRRRCAGRSSSTLDERRPRDRDGSGRASPPQHRARGRRGPDRPGVHPIGDARDASSMRCELIGYGKELPADEAIGVACGWWPSFSQPSGAFVKLNADGSGTIVTGAHGVRYGRGDGAADPGRRGARDAARGLQHPLPGHRRRPLGRRRVRLADDVQQRPGRDRGGRAGARAAARSRVRGARGRPRRSRAGRRHACGSRAAPSATSRSPSSPPRRTGASCCSATARARRSRRRSASRRPASAGWAWSRSSRRPSSRTRCAAGSIARPASCGCSRPSRCTTAA